MKEAFLLIRKDLKQFYKPLALSAILLITMKLITGNLCPFVLVTGFPCPGCGMTRAVLHLLHGEFYQAAVMNPFIYGIIGVGVYHLYCHYFLRKPWRYASFAWGMLFGFMVIYYIYRMIVWFPDRAPMQYYYNSILYRILG